MSKKLTIEDMQELAKERGGKCLSEEYQNNDTPLQWECSEKHRWYATPHNVKNRKSWCRICSNVATAERRRSPLSEVHSFANSRGGKCLSNSYKNNSEKLEWQCAEGHRWSASFHSIKGGSWCPTCAGSQLLSIEEMHVIANSRGGKCLSSKYLNSKTKLFWECAEGHRWYMTANALKSGRWCPQCSILKRSNHQKNTIEEMKSLALERRGKCLSDKYVNNKTLILWECAEGHQWLAKPNSILSGRWCPECSTGISERVCRKFFELLFKTKFEKSKPKWLQLSTKSRLELDGYAKEIGVAFEYQGQQHYEIKGYTKNRNELVKRQEYDQTKRDRCIEHNVVLIEVPYHVGYTQMEEFIRKECEKAQIKIPRKDYISKEEISEAYLRYSPLLDELQKIARAKNGRLLPGQLYIDTMTPLLWECAEGHQWAATPDSVKRGSWCRICGFKSSSEKQRGNIAEMHALALAKGGKCLSDGYESSSSPLQWECSEGHRWRATPGNVKQGTWCSVCSHKRRAEQQKNSIEEYHAIATRKGGKCLSGEYVNNKTKLQFECANGHKWSALPTSIKGGKWCPKCAGKMKLTIDDMRKIAKSRGGKCLSIEYVNVNTHLLWECSEGHRWKALPGNIKNKSSWCPKCSKKKSRNE